VIPYGSHFVDEDDVVAVVDVLRNHHLTQGKFVLKFEKMMAEYVGAKYAVAVSSWTSGLHLACIAAGLKPGQVLITSPNTFVASSNAGLYVGAKSAFTDIDCATLNMSPEKLEEMLKNNPQIKVVIPVHFAGLSCDMEAISKIAQKYNVTLIEDAAHALGGTYRNGQKVGSCCYSQMTGFSFPDFDSF
jgi:dTDP-4-amino-4,6-dideoxygalactose transaminase